MQTITVELLNEKALALLKQLEQLKILRLLSQPNHTVSIKKRQWAGSISKVTASKMLQHAQQMRNEWERI